MPRWWSLCWKSTESWRFDGGLFYERNDWWSPCCTALLQPGCMYICFMLLGISPPLGWRSIVMTVSVWVCVCVCVFVCPQARLWDYTSGLHQIFMHVAYCCGLVLLWWHCNTLCISGFMDDVIFAHDGPRCLCNTGTANQPLGAAKWLGHEQRLKQQAVSP